MTRDLNGIQDIDFKLTSLLDGTLAETDRQQLEQAIVHDPEVRQYCQDYFLTCAAVRHSSWVTGELSEADLLAAIRRTEPGTSVTRRRWIGWALAAAAVLVLVVSLWTLHGTPAPTGPVTGQLVAQSQARWARPWHKLTAGMSLHTDELVLEQGAAEVVLSQGVRVILQAPASFQLLGDNQLSLTQGKLYARVPREAQGFVVQTPFASWTDLGTEFGVLVDPNGPAEGHVFVGRVEVTTTQQEKATLNAGRSARVEKDGYRLLAQQTAEPDRFLSSLPQPGQRACPGRRLNLADIVGGGQGYGSGAFETGLDVTTGEVFTGVLRDIYASDKARYVEVPGCRAIDGVFVPNGLYGPITISSTDLTFDHCPITQGTYYEGIANTGKITSVEEPERIYIGKMKGQTLGTLEHPALSLHPNAGVTFDLNQIRADHPGLELSRFTTRAGLSEDIAQTRKSEVHVWVLLDGEVAVHLNYPRLENNAADLDIPISKETRFLTLMSACPRDAGFSWIFMAHPMLEFE